MKAARPRRRETSRSRVASRRPPSRTVRPAGSALTASPQQRRSQNRPLIMLAAGLALGAFSVWLLRQDPRGGSPLPWIFLAAGAAGAAFALLRLDKWLPSERLPKLAESPPTVRSRLIAGWGMAAAVVVSFAIGAWLWPDFRSRWHGIPIVWIAAIAVLLFSSKLWGRVYPAKPRDTAVPAAWSASARNTWLEIAAFLLIFAVGAAVRLYQIDRIPPAIFQDETSGANEALYILEGRPTSPFGTGWGWVPNGYFYYWAGILKVFGAGWLGLRLPSVLPALLTLPAIYLLGRLMFGRLAGLLAMALLALSRWHFGFSRWSWMITAPPFFEVLAFFFLLRGLRYRRALDFAACGVLAGLSLYTYFAARVSVATILLFVLYWLLTERGGFKTVVRRNWQGVLLVALAAAVVVTPLAVTYVHDQEAFGRHIANLSIFNSVRAQGNLRPLMENLLAELRVFHQLGPSNGRLNLPGEPALDPVTGLFFVIGLGYSLMTWKDHRSFLLLLWLGAGMAASFLSINTEGPNTHRSLIALPAVLLMAAVVLARLALIIYHLLRRFEPRLRGHGLAALGATCLVGVVLFTVGRWETNIYFGPQATSIDTLRGFNPIENGVARDTLEALSEGTTVYMSPYFAAGQSIVRYVAYGAVRESVDENPLDKPPYKTFVPVLHLPLMPDGRDAVLLLDKQTWALKDYIAKLYPGAISTLVRLPDQSPLYVRVNVPAQDIEGLQGWTELIRYEDGRTEERKSETLHASPELQGANVEWLGTLKAERSGEYSLLLDGEAEVYLDGLPWTGTRYLGLGLYELRVVKQAGAPGPVSVRWKPPEGELEPLPRSAVWNITGPRYGVLGTYWANPSWSGEWLFQQVTPLLLLEWPGGQQPVPGDWSARFTGILSIPEDDTYSFALASDDGSRLVLDGRVVAEGLISGRENISEVALDLSEGEHPIQIDYFQQGGNMALRLYWRRGAEPWSAVPPEALSPVVP